VSAVLCHVAVLSVCLSAAAAAAAAGEGEGGGGRARGAADAAAETGEGNNSARAYFLSKKLIALCLLCCVMLLFSLCACDCYYMPHWLGALCVWSLCFMQAVADANERVTSLEQQVGGC
jgi:hypothetical protein